TSQAASVNRGMLDDDFEAVVLLEGFGDIPAHGALAHLAKSPAIEPYVGRAARGLYPEPHTPAQLQPGGFVKGAPISHASEECLSELLRPIVRHLGTRARRQLARRFAPLAARAELEPCQRFELP